MTFYIKINTIKTILDHKKENYDWKTEELNEITSFNSSDNLNFDLLVTADEVKNEYYLVYGVYSTGDSFGVHTGNIEYLKLFKDLKEANLFKQDLENYEKYCLNKFKNQKYLPKYIKNLGEDDERKFTYLDEHFYLPWDSYNDILEKIIIKKIPKQ